MGYIIPSCVRDSTFSRFGTVRACDRQTDGRTRGRTHGPTHDDSIYLASIASRGINLMTEIFLLRPWTWPDLCPWPSIVSRWTTRPVVWVKGQLVPDRRISADNGREYGAVRSRNSYEHSSERRCGSFVVERFVDLMDGIGDRADQPRYIYSSVEWLSDVLDRWRRYIASADGLSTVL